MSPLRDIYRDWCGGVVTVCCVGRPQEVAAARAEAEALAGRLSKLETAAELAAAQAEQQRAERAEQLTSWQTERAELQAQTAQLSGRLVSPSVSQSGFTGGKSMTALSCVFQKLRSLNF